ncbi:hypothetical protein HPB49_008401 [Dermacentor silvarum]|uniref:Uncharacterized protein n=1 Tax=Dermacentor silvarum TaxID=543639 RepID=A0ACB8DNT5_DERSI|nr:hypothetical protein HPB49_008401 [Dermacentor silvarum]
MIQQPNLTLLTDPSVPTRHGTSVSRETCPDLTFYHGRHSSTWQNFDEYLGSDHSIIATRISTKDFVGEARQIRLTDWRAFRAASGTTS